MGSRGWGASTRRNDLLRPHRENGISTSEAKETAKEVGIQAGFAIGAALLKSLLESE